MKHIVCYSGGHSSALAAIEVARRHGTANLYLVNHDIHPSVEAADIKRFKAEVAAYIGVPVSYANHANWSEKDQFDIVIEAAAFKVRNGTALCTHRLKTQPFNAWLEANAAKGCDILYYGFDKDEGARIQRRVGILSAMGYKSDYPLALWPRTIQSTKDVGIEPPNTYSHFKHANCTGCLKGGKQHWYIVFLTRPDLWEKGKQAEAAIGYAIINQTDYLQDLEADFTKMRELRLTTTEHECGRTFFARVRKAFRDIQSDEGNRPCECMV